MKIQFVLAPPRRTPRLGEMYEHISPPLGILYLAGYLREQIPDLELRAIDGPRKGYDFTLERIIGFNPDILCASYYVTSTLGAYEMIDALKQLNPGLLCIVGGHQVTALPGEALRRSRADIEVYSEGEVTLTEIVRAYKCVKDIRQMNLSEIQGVGYLANGELKTTPPRPLIQDLDTIPFPARDLIDMRDYTGWYITRQNPQARVIFARGCPYRCTFCSNKVWNRPGQVVRTRSAKNIADELEVLKRDYGVKEFFDDSDELNHNIPKAIDICNEIKNRKLDMTWKCQLRSNNLPEELARAMAEAGCWFVHLGIESANQRTLNGIRKGITVEQGIAACELMQRYGIKTLALFMLFNVWEEGNQLCFEGVKETRRTIAFARHLLKSNRAQLISSSPTLPYPGSELYDIAQRHGLIKEHLRDNWDAWLRDETFIMQLPGVTEKEMTGLRLRANILIVLSFLKFGHFSVKDIPFFIKRVIKVLGDNVKARIKAEK
ncbi:MAG: radical SAM protein [Thermodesulfobacteriota bacterium]